MKKNVLPYFFTSQNILHTYISFTYQHTYQYLSLYFTCPSFYTYAQKYACSNLYLCALISLSEQTWVHHCQGSGSSTTWHDFHNLGIELTSAMRDEEITGTYGEYLVNGGGRAEPWWRRNNSNLETWPAFYTPRKQGGGLTNLFWSLYG